MQRCPDCGACHDLTFLGSSLYQSLDELDFERGIWCAAMEGDDSKLRSILAKGIDPVVTDSSGYTALHYAARNGRGTCCAILLQHGADPNFQTPGGATPLHRAAYMGHDHIVSMLLQHNADPSIPDGDGRTALHKAAEGQNLEVAKKLISLSPELKSGKDVRGWIPVQYVDAKNSELVNLLTV